jgi:hypothetical protein
MSDNLRQYRAIRAALTQGYPSEPQGRCARHLATLTALISGIVASKSTQLPKVAAKVPDGTKPESRVKRLARWVDNDTITTQRYFLPYADVLLMHLALPTLVLVIEGSVAECGCVTLMLHVVYKVVLCHWSGRCAWARRGTFPKPYILPWSSKCKRGYPWEPLSCCSAMANSMGPASNKRWQTQAGPMSVVRGVT